MTMVMMPGRLTHGHYTAVRHFAFDMLELDGSVIDLELMVQLIFHIPQDALACRRWNIFDRDMAG